MHCTKQRHTYRHLHAHAYTHTNTHTRQCLGTGNDFFSPINMHFDILQQFLNDLTGLRTVTRAIFRLKFLQANKQNKNQAEVEVF